MYELWDVETGNVIAAYDDEASALNVVAHIAKTDGEAAVDCLALLRRTAGGQGQLVAEGCALAARARQAELSGTIGAIPTS